MIQKTLKQSPRDARVPLIRRAGGVSGRRLLRRALQRLLSGIGNPPITVVVGGREIESPDGVPIARVLIRDWRTVWKLCTNPMFQFGEAYTRGDLDVDGDLTELIAIVMSACNSQPDHESLWAHTHRWLCRPRRNSPSGSRHNIHHHYDIGNDFYRLWLDDQMVYTCAYFGAFGMSLEQAQIAKMDHVCRKLRLQPGETVVEAGCGWGALALHMARHYGVRVKAFNISREQLAYARRRAAREDLADRVEFVDDDWRRIDEPCDVFVSVGMLEHVGVNNYRQLSDVINRCLTTRGRGLIHSIGQNRPQPFSPWIERRIFPGAYPPALREMMDLFEPHDFSVLDIENLRLHYARTLRHWLERYEESVDAVRQMFDERFVRMWRLYLSGSIAGFESGGLQLFQVLFARGDDNLIPWTRADLYAGEACESESDAGKERCSM